MGRLDNRPVAQPSFPLLSSLLAAKAAQPGESPAAQAPIAPMPSHPVVTETAPKAPPKGQAMPTLSLAPAAPPESHTVSKNESLSSIAKKYFGDSRLYMNLYQANRDIIKHPNQIQPGMVLKLPPELFPQPQRSPEPATVVPSPSNQPPAQAKPAVPAKSTTANPNPALNAYRKQNPLAYLTLTPTNEPKVDSTHLVPSLPLMDLPIKPMASHAQSPADIKGIFDDIAVSHEQPQSGTITHKDAIKVNKSFDIRPALTTHNLTTQFAPWAKDVAAILRSNQADIRLPSSKGQPVTLTADKLEELASKPANAADYFRKELGIALFNTLFAIDDVASDMKSDPYYADVRKTPKTVDLARVADKFNLLDDQQSYLAQTAAHRHKQVPIQLHGAAASAEAAGPIQTSDQMIAGLAKHFNSKGVLSHPAEFENDVYRLLENQSARRQLVQKFKLDSAENLNVLAPAITSEGGMGDKQRTYNSYFSVGSVMLNRALGRNLRKAAAEAAQGKPAAGFKPVGMRDILFEQGQFEITWRKMPGSSKTFFQYSQGLNQSFLNNKLGGDSRQAFETAYEAARDLTSGMHQLKADVNGVAQKNSGRSTGSLFYFNQSRSQNFTDNPSAAVSLIDSNNTHVFFKEWDNRAYFRD